MEVETLLSLSYMEFNLQKGFSGQSRLLIFKPRKKALN